MSHYICKDRYRLELHWDKLEYHDDSTARLIGAKFKGPVLRNAQQIQAPDFIDLNLTPQLLHVFDSYYVVRLAWAGVEYNSDGEVLLNGATLVNDSLKTLHKLIDDDYIVVDTEKHEEATHANHLLYDSQVVRADRKPYRYASDG